MIKLGIIGYPLGHSLSAVMHEAALKEMGIEGEYHVLETPQEDLIDTIKRLRVNGYTGFNVTIPHKVVITPFLSEVDDYANIVGAVNTVLIREDKQLYGYNTDLYGFVSAIPEEKRNELKGKKAAILGSGGAARAVAAGLAMTGITELTFYARDKEKTKNLKNVVCANFPKINVEIKDFNEYADLNQYSIIVNTTPLGMYGVNEDRSPLTKRAIESLPDSAIVYDLVYRPRQTKLLQYADSRDLITIDGTEMLVLQGVKALEIWTNQKAPTDIMRQALLKKL